MEQTEIIERVNPKDFGLEVKNVKGIEQAFIPKIIERNALVPIYETLIQKELTEELSAEAKELRLKLRKIRTGIADIHKTQKAFFLASGKFVDAWKKKETLPITQMEEKLVEIEKYAEIQEQKRLDKIQNERAEELSKYVEDAHERRLADMEDDVWNAYITAKKNEYNDRIAAEKQAEDDRKERLRLEKENKKRLEEENKKLLALKEIRLKRESELTPYLIHITNYNELIELPQEQYKIQLDKLKEIKQESDKLKAEKQAKEESERKEREAEARREREEYKLKLKKEREEKERIKREESIKREKLEDELRAKKEAELKEIEDAELRKQAELQKGDKEKMQDLIADLTELKSKYSFKSKKAIKQYEDTKILLDKVILFLTLKPNLSDLT